MSHTEGERLAVLEEQHATQKNIVTRIGDDLSEIKSQVIDINLKMAKNVSFLGGISFAFSIIGGFIMVIANDVLHRVGLLH